MKVRKLQTRIVIAFALLLLGVQALSLVVINAVLSKRTNDEIEQSLKAGERVFSLLREDNGQQLVHSASILSSDFAFREAIATADRATVTSALANHGARIHADVMMLVGPDNAMIADTRRGRTARAFPFPELIRAAEQTGQAASMVMLDGQLHQLVVVPVLAPLPIAWLALGFRIDDNFAHKLQSLTGLEVSFASGAPNGWRLLASTLPVDRAATLPAALSRDAGATRLSLDGEDYLAHVSRLDPGEGRTAVVAVLQRSLHEALEPLRRLQAILGALSLASLLGTIAASTLVARGISRPVSGLAQLASRVQQGDYSQSMKVEGEDEIAHLAQAFNQMSEGIAARETRISELAYRDQLTGLPNRTLFTDRLDQAIRTAKRNGKPFTLLFMDLDRFKEVNDILGHHVGDLLLRQVAERMQGALMRDSDTVARLGGDEFAALLPSCDGKGATVIARRLLEILRQPILLENQNIIAGGSIGLAVFPQHGDELNTLMRQADLAMYEAKHQRSGYALFDPVYADKSQFHLSLMAELQHAVEHDELSLHYQPKVDLRTGRVGHVEALIRWVHPRRGVVSPAEFIPFAENTGYISAITAWVFKTALRQSAAWRAQQLPLCIAINISTRDLMNVELPVEFGRLMRDHAAEPGWLSLEITESAIMADAQRALAVLEDLHGMGLKLSVDDFGTGYSSLAYLKKLPVAELKIDQSFVRQMETDGDDAAIVRSTIDLAHNMGLKVVAEGVENQATWTLLKEMGCDFAQGYFIGKPMSARDLLEWIENSEWTMETERSL